MILPNIEWLISFIIVMSREKISMVLLKKIYLKKNDVPRMLERATWTVMKQNCIDIKIIVSLPFELVVLLI